MNVYDVIKKPIVTEKSNLLKEGGQVYMFEVDKRSTKPLIKKSIESLFKVKVRSVRTSISIGKRKRFGKEVGKTKSFKKAFVTLTEGKIELFEGV